MTDDEIEGIRKEYLGTWIRALRAAFGWSPERVREWARQYEDGLNGVDSWFTTEWPAYYILPLLTPDRIQPFLDTHEYTGFWGKLETVFYGFDTRNLPEYFDAGKARVYHTIEDLAEFTRNPDPETFDFDAAITRVRHFLAKEYNEELPMRE